MVFCHLDPFKNKDGALDEIEIGDLVMLEECGDRPFVVVDKSRDFLLFAGHPGPAPIKDVGYFTWYV